jgi:hypothetical protein
MPRSVSLVALATGLLAIPVFALVSPPPDPSPASSRAGNDPVADSLVRRWVDAVGGLEAFRRLEGARYTLTTEMWDPESGRLRRTRPRYVTIAKTPRGQATRIERWEGNDFIAHGTDGDTVWATYNGEPLSPGDKDYDEVRYVSGDVHYWIGLPYKLLDPGVNLHDLGRDQGMHLVGVSFGEGVGLHDGDQWRYWFREGETWPEKLAYREEGRENWNVLSFQDVRTVDGYVFVGRRVHVDEDGGVWKILRTHDFELNPDLEMERFRRP